MRPPQEAARAVHLDDGVSWHVMCHLCPEIPSCYGMLPPHVCREGCYATPEEAQQGVRRHMDWHRRHGG